MLPISLLSMIAVVQMPGKTGMPPLEVAGVSLTPHVRAETMRFASDPGKAVGALVRLFVRNPASVTADKAGTVHCNEVLFDGRYPMRWLMDGQWAWHDTPNLWREGDRSLPPGAVSVWTFNSVSPKWNAGRTFTIGIEDWTRDQQSQLPVTLTNPKIWLSAVTFLCEDDTNNPLPETLVYHIANESGSPINIAGTRLYLPEKPRENWHVFLPQPPLDDAKLFPAGGVIPDHDKGGARVKTGPLPLTYAVMEVSLTDVSGKPLPSLWAKVRVKRERFDISGGWVSSSTKDGTNALTHEPYLKTLQRMHINQMHHGHIPGFTDQDGPKGLYTRYPFRYFDGLTPVEQYDTDAIAGRVHGVDALGEPQLSFSKDQKLPQEVWKALEVYAPTRLPTTLTLNDEGSWRYYAGLSDYPHHDNYRVTAPATDAWRKYDRWGKGLRIGWGAPLETIGDLQRSLREMSRPAPTAYWGQGPSDGWDVYDGRVRVSPTPDEIRLQAYHALSSRITSFYWFNLSLKALATFRDTHDELTRCGREMRLLEEFYLEGDAYRYTQTRRGGKLDWDLASIASPQGALLFALDLDYEPDLKKKVFAFKPPRPARLAFDLPAYLRSPVDVFRIDADGISEVRYRTTAQGVEIEDSIHRVGIYVVTGMKGLRARLEAKRKRLVAEEEAVGFDPARNDGDFNTLRALAPKKE